MGVCIKGSLFADSVVVRCVSVCIKVDANLPECGFEKGLEGNFSPD